MLNAGKESNRLYAVYWEINKNYDIRRGSSKVWRIFELSKW